ncbi:MAG: NADH-quinone oxidoreductase subunit C [Acidimicrobiaceae bacterium]|nr:NADH-quinone oxidoreductase subunit C [Acidimicrobiaceae bacterium]
MTGPEAGGVDPEAGAPDDTAGEPVGPSAWGVPVTESFGQVVLHPPVDRWLETVAACRDDGYVMAIDLTAVDYSAHPGRTDLPEGVQPERFEVVASLLSHATGDRVRLRTQVPESDPVVPSLFDLYPGTEAMEREAWDLLGVSFSGHPDHTRILMPEDWEGHPLRRDVAIGRIPVEFRDAPSTR